RAKGARRRRPMRRVQRQRTSRRHGQRRLLDQALGSRGRRFVGRAKARNEGKANRANRRRLTHGRKNSRAYGRRREVGLQRCSDSLTFNREIRPMRLMRNCKYLFSLSLCLAMGSVRAANAGVIPYPDAHTPNPITYTFTAAATGDVTAYFAGTAAQYSEQLGML